jgi:hypothetical protein
MISEITMLIRIMVVMGIYRLKPGRLTIISPGSLPNGSFPIHGHKSPTTIIISPRIIIVFLK